MVDGGINEVDPFLITIFKAEVIEIDLATAFTDQGKKYDLKKLLVAIFFSVTLLPSF